MALLISKDLFGHLRAALLVGALLVTAVACGDQGASTNSDGLKDSEPTSADIAEAGASGTGPEANRDHWHAGFAVNICGEFLDPFADTGPDTLGIHSHLDGLIHIHPFVEDSAGPNAVLRVFLDAIGVTVDDGELHLPTGEAYADGDDCDGSPGRVSLFAWGADAHGGSSPTRVSSDIASHPLAEDGERFVLAFLPDIEVPPEPPSTPDLQHPSDMPR